MLIFALALCNGILYCCVLPLWEGFDEPFHYGYIQSLSVNHVLPVMGHTSVSSEIYRSLLAVPVSRLLSEALPGAVSFEEWARLTFHEKQIRSKPLDPNPSAQQTPSSLSNYEAQQAPLFYLVGALFDLRLRNASLRSRILTLRLLGIMAALVLLWIALLRLAKELAIPPTFASAALLCVFELQMLWASVAHVANDVLSVPVTALFLAWLVAAARSPSTRRILFLSSLLAVGLLAKAYFLAFVPVFAVFLIRLLINRRTSRLLLMTAAGIVVLGAGPWYLHNYLLYGSVSGTQQSLAGIGLFDAARAFAAIPWPQSALSFARWSLWTGNWSFVSFSRVTLDLQIALLLVGCVLYLVWRKTIGEAESWLLAAFGCFALSLLYQAGVTFVHTHGQSIHPEPWYAQGVLVCVILLAFRGFAQAGVFGQFLAIALCLVFGWVALATYFVKLLPYYGGAVTRGNFPVLWSWWTHNPVVQLSFVTLAPVPFVFVLLAGFSVLVVVSSAVAIRTLWFTEQY